MSQIFIQTKTEDSKQVRTYTEYSLKISIVWVMVVYIEMIRNRSFEDSIVPYGARLWRMVSTS